jgi:uncharacterized protein
MIISINDKTFDCEIADTEESRAKGLQFRNSSPPILFIFDSPEDVRFHMHNCKFPVDMIFLDENKEIIKVYEASPEEENIECLNVKYVLEAQDSGVKIGDKVMFNEKVAKIAKEIKEAAGFLKGDVPMVVYDSLTVLEQNIKNLKIELKKGDYNKILDKTKTVEYYASYLTETVKLAQEHWGK